MFEIDADIRKAKTLPAEFYTDERYFELSKEKIFAKSWQFAGSDESHGNLRPLTILPDFLDEPLLLISDENGARCFSNVCTHRGKILVEDPCEASLIRCGYHGRRFTLDGKFLSMPEFEGVEHFPSSSDDLTAIASAQWGKFPFVSLAPAIDLEQITAEFASIIDIDGYAAAKLTGTRDYELNAHWALYCENYLEGFHIPFVHRSLNEIVDYGSYKTEIFRYSSLQTGFDDNGNIAGQYLFIFPNTMFNFYPWGISVNIVKPVTATRTLVTYFTYVLDESLTGSGAGGDLDHVEMEDQAVVESVQKGIRSRFYSQGRYSPAREQGTHHFHRLVAESIN